MVELRRHLEDEINKIREGGCLDCIDELIILDRKKSLAGIKILFFETRDKKLHLEIKREHGE